jgi:hypothetical protein
MDTDIFSEGASTEEIIEKVAALADSHEDAALQELKTLLNFHYTIFGDNHISVTRLAARALLQKGKLGIQLLSSGILDASFEGSDRFDVGVMLEALWYAAHGQLPPKGIMLDVNLIPPLENLPSSNAIKTAQQAFHEIVEESQLNEDLFEKLLLFQFQAALSIASLKDELPPDEKKAATDLMRSVVFELFAEPAIKITSRLISTFESLVSETHGEEEYQKFLTKHPVFIDPLASEVIPKQKLGLEHITDFVIRRLDNEYIVVEIEKPQDTIFTGGNDLTAKFTHAYGQVLDFQEWVDAHGEYARSLMPGVVSPKGVLVIGMREHLSVEQIAKLKRFIINSRSIEVFTYDDLIKKAKDLYRNIYRKRT